MADDPERLLQRYGYGDPRWLEPGDLTDSKLHPPAVNEFALPPKAPAEVRNDSTRPDAYVDKNVREFMPPTVFAGSYGLGRTLGTAYGDLRMGDYAGAAHALPEIAMAVAPMPGAKGPKLRPRELDKLGYYSQALEAAKAWPMEKGTPEQALAYLKKAGTKDAEIKATALDKYLAEQDGVITRQGLEDYLRKNRVELQEGKYGPVEFEVRRSGDDALMDGPFKRADEARWALRSHKRGHDDFYITEVGAEGTKAPSKWSDYSLDPDNPTYRESVLHLGPSSRAQEIEAQMKENQRVIHDISEQAKDPRATPDYAPLHAARKENAALLEELRQINAGNFKGGHWDEPNVMAHARTSVQRDLQGRPVYLIDELQSDWGQKIREGGARDDAKIAELQKRYDAAKTAAENARQEYQLSLADSEIAKTSKVAAQDQLSAMAQAGEAAGKKWKGLDADASRLYAELRTAEAGAPSHPLVNTTDQWTTTAIRRLLQDAAEKDAAGIALTPGQLQNERFNLSKQVEGLRYVPETKTLMYRRPGNEKWELASQEPIPSADLPQYIGKEAAQRLLGTEPALVHGMRHDAHTLLNLENAELGGSGMRYAYDQMYPKMLEKQLRKLDPEHPGRGQVTLQATDNMEVPKVREIGKEPIIDMPFSYFELTPRVKEEIKKGLPLFSLGALTTADLLRRYYGEEQ